MLVADRGAMEFRFPPGTSLLDAILESRVTVRQYVERMYPAAKLTPEEFKTLGGLVAKAARAHDIGGASMPMSASVDGEKHSVNSYFFRDIDGPPLVKIVETFVKEAAAKKDSKKRKQTGPIESFFQPSVVTGLPVP